MADDTPWIDSPLPWQAPAWQLLSAKAGQHQLPHALLISGLPGTGKAQFCRALAHSLLCEHPDGGRACGHCRQCGFARAGTHPDLLWVAPEEKGKQIRVDQVRSVVGFLSHTAQQGGYKICVLQPADSMNTNAANALLKSLEEPAGQTLLMLITDVPSRLLATIRSRCQQVRLPAPSNDEARGWLEAHIQQPDQVLGLLQAYPRQPLRALACYEAGEVDQLHQWDSDWLGLLAGQSSPLTLAQDWQQYPLADLLNWMSGRVSSLISALVAGTPLSQEWGAVLKGRSAAALYPLLDQIHSLNQQLIKGGNPNGLLAMENLLLISCDKFHN